MAPGHLVSHLDLTLLGNINLCSLYDATGKFVSDCFVLNTTTELCFQLLILTDVISDKGCDKFICMGVFCPVATLYVAILVNAFEHSSVKLPTGSNDLKRSEVLYKIGSMPIGELEQLINKYFTKLFFLFAILTFDTLCDLFDVLTLLVQILGEELGINNDPAQ